MHKISAVMAFACVGLITQWAVGDDSHGHVPRNEQAPESFAYPKGSNIKQTYRKFAPAEVTGLKPSSLSAASDQSGVTGTLYTDEAIGAAAAKGLVLLPRTAARVAFVSGVAALGESTSADQYSFDLQYKGVRLAKFSSISTLVQTKDGNGSAVYLRERNLPKMDALTLNPPKVTVEQAIQVAIQDANDNFKMNALEVDKLSPAPHNEIYVDKDGNPGLAWTLYIGASDRRESLLRQYWVSADEAKVLHKEDRVYFADPNQVTANIWDLNHSPLDPPAKAKPLSSFAAQTRPGGAMVVTDKDGKYVFQSGATLNKELFGPYGHVINENGSPLQGKVTGNDIFFDANTESELAQTSAFRWVSHAHEFVRDHLNGEPPLLRNLPLHVNIDDSCNAFWDGGSLNFFRAGGECPNTASADVAFHEFGHGVDAAFGGIEDGAYSEGFGDSVAILITRDSIIGRDFKGKGKHLRNAKDVVNWPPVNPEVHAAGRIYGGFTWELTRQLMSKYGNEDQAFAIARRLILGAAAQNPKDIPDAVLLSFAVDKVDGSKHFAQLAAAADSRKIPRPKNPETLGDPTNFNVAASP